MQIGLDITLFFQIALFLITVFIVNKLIVQPIHSTYTKRDADIEALNAKVQANLDAIESKRLEYEAKLQAVKAEIAEYQTQLRKGASSEAQAIMDKAKAEAMAELEAKRAEIENEVLAARAALHANVAEFSKEIVAAVTK
ncbi:MAG: ATP synthase F0 subunit B [Deferribacteraceae bacterium]|nr:ATP synthase F0 subunit B [Deferribacteraceae bacterium]